MTTDVPAAPSLSIASPTPRAFAFPASHNLSSDSPYSSPSHSPFEPDNAVRSQHQPQFDPNFSFSSHSTSTFQSHPSHYVQPSQPFTFHTNNTTLSLNGPTPPPPYHSQSRSFTPDSLRSTSPTPSHHKRRKSSCSSVDSERRPKKGDEDYIKRPENAFILFRRKCCEDRQNAAEEAANMADGPQKKQRQADLSKTISQQWKSLSAEERAYWENLAKEKKKEHEAMYPNYVYRPQRTKDKDGKRKKSTSKRRGEDDEGHSVQFVVPVQSHGRGGRSASVPTPPPYQAIRIPQVYHLSNGSAPTSPSLLPMISKHSTQQQQESNGFDFLPTTNYVPPMFAMGGSSSSGIDERFQVRILLSYPYSVINRSL